MRSFCFVNRFESWPIPYLRSWLLTLLTFRKVIDSCFTFKRFKYLGYSNEYCNVLVYSQRLISISSNIKILTSCSSIYVEGMELAALVVGGTSTPLTGSGGPRGMSITWHALPAFLAKGSFPRERSLLWWKRKSSAECIMTVCWIIWKEKWKMVNIYLKYFGVFWDGKYRE